MNTENLFYANAKGIPGIVLGWVASWFEAIGAIMFVIATKLYHWAGMHQHCSRQHALAETARTLLDSTIALEAYRQKVIHANEN